MARWKYGVYEFKINPNSSSETVTVVGDDVRTLSGRHISQPTALTESYEVQAVFFQPRTRVLSEVGIEKAEFIEAYDSKLYVLNKQDDRIDIYNKNFILESAISLSSVTNKNFLGLDVVQGGIWIISTDGTNDIIYKIDFSGGKLSETPVTKDADYDVTGIQEMNGYLCLLRGSKIDLLVIPSMTKLSSINIPFSLHNKGLSQHNGYLIVGSQDEYLNKVIYHANISNGELVSSISNDEMTYIADVTYLNDFFITLNSDTGKIKTIRGNTTLVDIYDFTSQVENYNWVNVIDDMGVTRRVFTSNVSISRKDGFEHMYDVSMTMQKTDR